MLMFSLLGGVAGYNHVAVGAVVENAVGSDTRNDGLTFHAHFGSSWTREPLCSI